MPAGAYRRFIRSEGRDATLREFATSGEDDWGDPTAVVETTTETSALVRYRGGQDLTVTAGGERVEIDAEIVVPDDVSVPDPPTSEHRPELDVGGRSYKIWAVDDAAVDGGRRLLATRK